ncbi:MAG: DUF2807 domain-containing protein [Flavobacteriaceae bacterium]|nr:DUF2807 domain-containing protein [Flavobacteriaceae bacterium]
MMIKKALFTLSAILLITTAYSQNNEKIKGSRNVTTQETPINSFNRIVVGEDFKIDLIEGPSASVFVEADDNLHDVIKFYVTDSTLTFNTSMRITTSKKISIKVSYTQALKYIETIEGAEVSSLTSINLDEVVLKHSGTSRAYLNIKTSKLKLINSEKAKLKLNINAKLASLELNENSKTEALIQSDSIQVDLYQRSEAKIEGDADYLNIRADNYSNFVGKNLSANSCDIIADLNCDVYVQVIDNLSIEASGNSEVYIYENPTIALKKFSDSAKLHKKELK